MSASPQQLSLDASLAERLRTVVKLVRGHLLVEGLAWLAWMVIATGIVQFTFDYGTRGLRWSIRAFLLTVAAGAVGTLIWRRLIAPLRVSIGLSEAAGWVERRHPELGSALVSAVRFATGGAGDPRSNSPQLMASVISSVASRLRDVEFRAVVDAHRFRRSAQALVGALALVLASVLAAPGMTGLWFARNVLLSDVEWPRRTRLTVDLPLDGLVGARGDDLVIQARADGVQPEEVGVVFTTASGHDGRETMSTMGPDAAFRYRFTFKNAQEDFAFRLVGGDDETVEYPVRLVDRPQVAHSRITIQPPAYTGLGPSTLGDGERSGQLLPGSTVRFDIQTNKPVTTARLMVAAAVVADGDVDDDQVTASVTPVETQTYSFALTDAFGLEDRNPARFALRMTKDEAPRVRLKLPGVGEMVTPEAVLPVELEFADTYGLATAELSFAVTRDDSREGPIALQGFSPRMTTFSTSLNWSVAEETPAPGDRLSLRARAADLDDVSGPNVAQAPEFSMRVVTREELQAEFARREQEFRMDLERLVDAQEQVRGRLLTLIGRAAEESDTAVLASELANLERRQRNIAGSVNVVRQQVEHLLTEMRINQLATKTAEERLGGTIAEPLGRLIAREFPLAADTIRGWGRDLRGDIGRQVDPQQVALLAQMRAVLVNMLQWEGYQEAVNMLRDIVRLQQELRKETKDAAAKQGAGVFDD